MKRILFMLAGLLFMFASCSDGGSDSPETPKPQPQPEEQASITLTTDIPTGGLVFDEQGGEKSVEFSTNKDWTLSIAATTGGTSWCTVSKESGSKGDATVTFTVAENTEYDDRSVSVTIKAGTASKTFKIAQKGIEGLLVTTNTFEVPQEGGTIDVEVKANIEYQLEIAETAKGWITEATSRALTTKNHSFAIVTNEESEKREGEIYIKSGDKLETVKVYQAGGALILLSQNEYIVSDAGETITVDVKSNVEYGVQMPDVDWIVDEASARGMSSHTLQYIILPNETYDSRSAEIIFYDKNSDLKDTLTIIQAQKDAIVLSKKEFEVEAEGEIIEVKLSTNVDVDVQIPSDATWITQTDSRALTEKSIYLKVAENTSEESRSVEVVFVNNESQISESITINQAGVVKAGYADGVVTIATAGTMRELLGTDITDIRNITSLKVVGPINGDDVYLLHWMLKKQWGELKTLDLSEATIVRGGSGYYSIHGDISYQPGSYKEYGTHDNEIGDYMFYGCNNLQNISLPYNVTSIGESAFAKCYALTEITIPDNVTSIGKDAFYDCEALTKVTIGDGVTSIGNSAFAKCYALTEITIPDNVTSIGKDAFYDCEALTKVTIGDGVTSIGNGAFHSCVALTEITIPDNVTSIGEEAFSLCYDLTKVTIGAGITEISKGAFFRCHDLTEITIPDNVTSIGESAFEECDALTKVTIGDGVTSIGNRAFSQCDALTEITIPDNVTSIDNGAFFGCYDLTEVTIGAGVTSIGNNVFYGCSINKLYCYATEPPTLGYDSGDTAGVEAGATLYVPAGCVSAYETSDWGKYFDNIIEMD